MSVLGWCFLAAGFAVLWLLIVFGRLLTRTDALPAGSADSTPGVVSRDATPGVARAALTPDCPTLPADLTSDYWRANPSEPLAPSEVVRWRGIVRHYEWVAAPAVPGRSES